MNLQSYLAISHVIAFSCAQQSVCWKAVFSTFVHFASILWLSSSIFIFFLFDFISVFVHFISALYSFWMCAGWFFPCSHHRIICCKLYIYKYCTCTKREERERESHSRRRRTEVETKKLCCDEPCFLCAMGNFSLYFWFPSCSSINFFFVVFRHEMRMLFG